jgi:outer membrane biogenesis lipoprotein LolB
MYTKTRFTFLAVLIIVSLLLLLSGCFVTNVPETNTSETDETTGTSQQTLPVINQFSASPDSISSGEVAKLSWSVSNASTITIDNAWAM